MRKITLIVLLSFLVCSPVFAIDNKIRVLGVIPTSVPSSAIGHITNHMQAIANIWNGSIRTTGVTIELVNAGLPVPLLLPLAGTTPQILALAIPAVNTVLPGATQSLRDQNYADIVIVFYDGTSDFCGQADTGAWWGPGSTFVGTGTNNLDLRSQETSAVAVVNIACPTYISAHETGHLLGGGHFYATAPSPALNDDSKGVVISDFVEIMGSTYGVHARSSVTNSDSCDSQNPLPCVVDPAYSALLGFSNMKAFDQTALSVANYRTEPPPLVLVPPIQVSGYLVGHCAPPPFSMHNMSWEEGGSTAEVTYYLVEGAFYPGGAAVNSWTSSYEGSLVYPTGTSFYVSARACNSSACSARSSTYLATWTPCD